MVSRIILIIYLLALSAGASSCGSGPTDSAVEQPVPSVETQDSVPDQSLQPVADTTVKGVKTRCMGFTKSGERCKRMTEEANGYCWQHQPK
jgi:hypothetical protein